MKLTTLEDDFGKFTPIQPQTGCRSCGSKGVNINITNTANGNTASGNSNSTSNPTSSANNGFTNNQTDSRTDTSARPGQIIQPQQNPIVRPIITTGTGVNREPLPKTDDGTRSLLQKILDKINTPREPQRIETERKPEKVKYLVKERQVKVPVDRPIPYVKEKPITDVRDRPVPFVKENEIIVEKDRPVPFVKEREVPRFFDRVKEKVTVIRANQPPAPASFS